MLYELLKIRKWQNCFTRKRDQRITYILTCETVITKATIPIMKVGVSREVGLIQRSNAHLVMQVDNSGDSELRYRT